MRTRKTIPLKARREARARQVLLLICAECGCTWTTANKPAGCPECGSRDIGQQLAMDGVEA